MKRHLLGDKNKLKHIIQCVIFFVIFFGVFSKITWMLRGNDSEAREDIYGFRNQGKVDVVLYGGSNLLRYYQPLEAWKEKGYTSYNYATSAAKADLLKAYIEESRRSNEATLYICDIRSFPMIVETVDDSSLRNWSDSLPPLSLARWGGISSFLFSRNLDGIDIPSFYFDIIKYHMNTEALKNSDQWRYWDLKSVYNIDKGFEPNNNHVPFERPKRVYDVGKLTEQQEGALNDLLDYCDDNNLQILFICCPYIIPEDDWLIINAVGEEIVSRGYTFINFNDYYDDIGLDFETDFGDVNHVNFLGAEKYTSYIMNHVLENYDLKDHRGEEEYSQWNSDYEEFAISQTGWKDAITALVDDHSVAESIGSTLGERTDFYDWYSMIGNSNYTVIISINDMPQEIMPGSSLHSFIKDYQIDNARENYIGVWVGESVKVATSDTLEIETQIGIDGGRGTDKCLVSLNSNSIIIGETDYSIDDAKIQVLVYDNNYKKVIDNVMLEIDSTNSIILRRP